MLHLTEDFDRFLRLKYADGYTADMCGSGACHGTLFLLTGPSEFSPGNYLEENGELFHSKVVLNGINLAKP